MDAKLVVVAGKADKQEIDLNLPMILGRQRDADLVIIHKSVSRHHCQIFEREGRLFVRDNQSSNGTFINDRQVAEAVLNPGDRLTVGPLTFVAKYNPYGGSEPLEVEDDGLDMAVSSVAIAEDEESGEDLPEARSAESGEESELDLASFGITAAEEPSTNATETDETFQWTESNHGVLALGESSSVDLEFDPQSDAEGVVSEVPLPAPHDDLPLGDNGLAQWGQEHEEQSTSQSLPTEVESFLPPSIDAEPNVAVNPVSSPEGEDLADTLFFTPGAPRLPKGISHAPLPRKEAESDESLGAWLSPQDEVAESAPLMPETAGEAPGLWEEPAAADPYAGLPPMAGVPVAGVPMAGIPMAGIPAAVPMEVTEFADEQFPMDGSLLEEESPAMPAHSWPQGETASSGEAWPDLDAVPVEDLGMPAAEAADGWPTPETPPADPFAQWGPAGGAVAAEAEPMDLTSEDLAEAAAEPQYDWSKATAEAAAEDQEAAVPGKDTMDFGAWLANSAEVPQAAVPAQPHADLSADDLVDEDEPAATWAGVDDSSTDLPAAITEESAMIITQQADEAAVEPVAELSFDDLTEDNTSTTEPSGDLQPFFIPTADSQAEEPAEAFPFFTTDEPKPSDEEIDPNQFNFEKW